jgi:hypothetical protein
MDRKLIWTEKASGDIEAIVRYIARRDSKAAARIGFGIYERSRFSSNIPKPERFSMSCARAAGTSSSSDDGKLSTRFVEMTSSSAESGLRRWVKQTWRLQSESVSAQPSAFNYHRFGPIR